MNSIMSLERRTKTKDSEKRDVRRIRRALSSHCYFNRTELARKLNLKYARVARLIKKSGIKMYHISIEDIQEAVVKKECDSPQSLARELNITYPYAFILQEKFQFCFFSKSYRSLLKIRKMAEIGKNLYETAKNIDSLGIEVIYRYAKEHGIVFNDYPEMPLHQKDRDKMRILMHRVRDEKVFGKNNRFVYKLALRGLSLEEIGMKVGFSKERARQLICYAGLDEYRLISEPYFIASQFARGNRSLDSVNLSLRVVGYWADRAYQRDMQKKQ